MTQYNKQVAQSLYEELMETLKGTPDRIAKAPDEGPLINLICESLGKAVSAMKTTIR